MEGRGMEIRTFKSKNAPILGHFQASRIEGFGKGKEIRLSFMDDPMSVAICLS